MCRSSVSAWARRSATGESPSYMKLLTYRKANDDANGDGADVSTDTTRTLRDAMSAISWCSAGRSKTSRRHSRYVSSRIGNEP